MSQNDIQSSNNCLIYTSTKLHTTIDGLVDPNHPQQISQAHFEKSVPEVRTTLFDGYYNFISILKQEPNERIVSCLNKIYSYYIDLQDDLKKIHPKFSFYSIANQYNPKLSHVENLENNAGIQIYPNSRIKCGRVMLDLILFVNDHSNLRNELNNIMYEFNINNSESVRNHEECYQPESIKPEDICRICLSSSTPENPLISLCRCKGSVKFYHLDCIRQWIETKKCKFSLKKSNSFHWKKLKCESCLSDFPIFMKYKGIIEPLVNIEFPNKRNYFILKSAVEDKNQYISIYLCYSDDIEDNFYLGRKMDKDIRIGDFSVSVDHAIFKLDNNGLYLYDNGSKYGTYTQVKKGYPLEMEMEHRFLMDKNLIKLKVTGSEEGLNAYKDEMRKNPFKSYLTHQSINEEINIKGKGDLVKVVAKREAKVGAKNNKREIKAHRAEQKLNPICALS